MWGPHTGEFGQSSPTLLMDCVVLYLNNNLESLAGTFRECDVKVAPFYGFDQRGIKS